MKRLAGQAVTAARTMARAITTKEGLKAVFGVSLYRNAFFLVLYSGGSAVLGFVFWILAARLYRAEDVGLASAAIAAVGLLATLANLGLDFGLVRFLPGAGSRANSLVNTCFAVSALASIAASAVFLLGTGVWAPDLAFLRHSPLSAAAFVLVVMVWAVYILLNNAFVAHRRSQFSFIGGVAQGVVKIALIVVLAGFASNVGILAAWGGGIAATLLVGILVFLPRLQKGYFPVPVIRGADLRAVARFSLANYLSALLSRTLSSVMPLVVVAIVGAEQNAYFYMAYGVVSNGLLLIPANLALSLFAEGSHDEASLGLHVKRSLKAAFVMLIPLIVVVFFAGDKILLVFGREYSTEATQLLRVLALSALPSAVNTVYLYQKRVQKQMGTVVTLTAVSAAMILGVSFILLPQMGIMGAGIAVAAASGSICLGILATWALKQYSGRKHDRELDVRLKVE